MSSCTTSSVSVGSVTRAALARVLAIARGLISRRARGAPQSAASIVGMPSPQPRSTTTVSAGQSARRGDTKYSCPSARRSSVPAAERLHISLWIEGRIVLVRELMVRRAAGQTDEEAVQIDLGRPGAAEFMGPWCRRRPLWPRSDARRQRDQSRDDDGDDFESVEHLRERHIDDDGIEVPLLESTQRGPSCIKGSWAGVGGRPDSGMAGCQEKLEPAQSCRVAEERRTIFQSSNGVGTPRIRGRARRPVEGRALLQAFSEVDRTTVSGRADRHEHARTGSVDEHGQPRRDGDVVVMCVRAVHVRQAAPDGEPWSAEGARRSRLTGRLGSRSAR